MKVGVGAGWRWGLEQGGGGGQGGVEVGVGAGWRWGSGQGGDGGQGRTEIPLDPGNWARTWHRRCWSDGLSVWKPESENGPTKHHTV